MIILLDTSSTTAYLTLIKKGEYCDYQLQADRQLAKNLLGWIKEKLQDNNMTWSDISGIGGFLGPGSFTGLRIGLTVLNTLADDLSVPIAGTKGEDWKNEAIRRLEGGHNDKILLPYYGSEAIITSPRK